MKFLSILSDIIGVIYTIAWSLSFWFQSIGIYKCQSAEGLSVNFLIMNFVGFYFYLSYNIFGYFYPIANYHKETHLEDVIFAAHALALVSLQVVQYYYYPKKGNTVNWWWVGFTGIVIIGVIGLGFGYGGENNVFFCMGIGKVVITFVKYIPQVWLNFSRKSCYGWAIENVLLDFTGGSLSFIQIFIDWADSGTTTQFSGGLNVAKFLLGIISMVFDSIFMVQHYLLYPVNKTKKGDNLDTENINVEDKNGYNRKINGMQT